MNHRYQVSSLTVHRNAIFAALLPIGLMMASPFAGAQSLQRDTPKKIDLETEKTESREFEVLDPNGNRALEVKYIVGKRSDRIFLNDSLDIAPLEGGSFVPRLPQMQTADQGWIALPWNPPPEMLVVWNQQGYCQEAISRLRHQSSIRLEPWATLSIKLETEDGDPDSHDSVSVESRGTSDPYTAGMTFVWRGTTDETGWVQVPHFPPGIAIARTHLSLVHRNNIVLERYNRNLPFRISPGDKVSLQMGSQGRAIHGEFSLPDGEVPADISYFKGSVTSKATQESVSLTLYPDGTFDSPRMPFGACTLRIEPDTILISQRDRNALKVAGDLDFECETGSSSPQNIGRIQLVSMGSDQDEDQDEHQPTRSIREPNQKDQKVALIVGTKNKGMQQYLLIDHEGKAIPTPFELRAPQFWGTASNQIARDPPRQRTYLIAKSIVDSNNALYTLDAFGRIVATRELDPDGIYRIALDHENGLLWLLCIQKLDKASVEVIDAKGRSIHSFPSDAFAMCYSDIDHAMWTVGAKAVRKCDARSGEAMATWEIPFRVWTLSIVLPAPEGGVLCAETQNPSAGDSSNRLYRIDSQAQHAICTDLGNGRIGNLAFFDDEIWVTGSVVSSVEPQKSIFERTSWCFDRELNFLEDRKLNVQSVAPAEDHRSIWCLQDGFLLKRVLGDDGSEREVFRSSLQSAESSWLLPN